MSVRAHPDASRSVFSGPRARRHLTLAVTGAALMAAVASTLHTSDSLFRLSMASAYVALLFLCVALVLGPWNVLRGRPNPVSTDLRRDVGIWAAILGVVHVVVGLQVHMRGKIWLYFFYPSDQPHGVPLRHDPFGFANYAGLGATLILLLLLAISNDVSLRALGTRRWKALQRWNYANVSLVALHSVAYQFVEKRTLLFVVVFSVMILGVAAMQLAGVRKMLSRSDRHTADPAST